MFEEGYSPETYKFPSNKLLSSINTAYITFDAEFEDDAETAGKKEKLDGLINDITQNIKNANYDDEFLVGSGQATNQDSAEKAATLNAAILAAYEAMAGEEKEITVDLDEYEVDEDSGKYVYLVNGERVVYDDNAEIPEGAELIPITVQIKYVEVDPNAIEAALATLETLANNEDYQNLEGYAPSAISIPSGEKVYHSVTIVNDGTYEIEITGASGGHIWTRDGYPAFGGNGGHIIARKMFNAGDVIKLRIGQEGVGNANYSAGNLAKNDRISYGAEKTGGWPNGGNGGASKVNTASSSGASGGGATEVYYAGNSSESNSAVKIPDSTLTRSDLVLVAGGGGGAAEGNGINSKGQGHPGVNGGDAGPNPVPAIKRGTVIQSNHLESYSFPGGLLPPYAYITSGDRSMLHTANLWENPYSYRQYASPDETVFTGNNTGQGVSPTYRVSPQEGLGGGGGFYGGNAIKHDSGLAGSGGGGSNYVREGYSIEAGTNGVSPSYGNGAFSIRYISESPN
ncbi:MAG: hypothetical protein LBC27_00650 [Spirochaetaceae bacterium]|jgi:hypothetical protein|nr:hypothetical protein [Spirochaetaceae bacterium]